MQLNLGILKSAMSQVSIRHNGEQFCSIALLQSYLMVFVTKHTSTNNLLAHKVIPHIQKEVKLETYQTFLMLLYLHCRGQSCTDHRKNTSQMLPSSDI
jgi:hypothetical protein